VGVPSDQGQRARLATIREGAVAWAENGAGTPRVILLGYLVKGTVFIVLAVLISAFTTPALGGLGEFGTWWDAPVFFQKTVVWALLFEVLGLGCSAGPMTQRIKPLIGGVLYWLRPGTMRLPLWPKWIPGTAGTVRTGLDVALYALVLASAVWALAMPGTVERTLQPWVLAPLAVLLPLLGLRDKTIFLAARAEHYWVLVLILMFPLPEQLAGAQLLTIVIWWGAALSKLNRHFPSVVAVMLSNSPTHTWKWLRRKLYRDYPNDLRPSWLAAAHAHVGTAIEFGAPFVLLISDGPVATVALIVMVLFHLNILAMFPMGVPFEWNVMVIFSAVVLFGGHGELGPADVSSPLLIAVLAISALFVLAGNLWPSRVSFLVSMRYYAGNWATSMWCFRGDNDDRIDTDIVKVAPSVRRQLINIYGEQNLGPVTAKQPVFRAMHLQGRALNGLLPRALDDVGNYRIIDGESFAGPILGWNFGCGHLHHQQLLDAVQQRCGFAPGELRVIMLESQPIHRQRQHYRIVDAATGLVEQGYVAIRDMADRQPWLSDDSPSIPVDVIRDH
jgi:hypothetical protein